MKDHDWDDDEREVLGAIGAELAALSERYREGIPPDLARAAHADALPDEIGVAIHRRLEESVCSRALVADADAVEPVLDPAAQARILARVRTGIESDRKPERPPTWFWGSMLALAAVVLVALFVSRTTRRPPPESTVARESAPPTSRASLGSPFRLPLEKPDVRFTASALVLRGDSSRESFVDAVAPAVAAYRSGDYAGAVRELEALQDRYPRSVEVFFYLGISRLFTDDVRGALDALGRARQIEDESFGPEISWYLAVANERAGQREAARAELGRLCRGASALTARACDAERQLE